MSALIWPFFTGEFILTQTMYLVNNFFLSFLGILKYNGFNRSIAYQHPGVFRRDAEKKG